MISRETRAGGLLRQLSRVRRMTGTGLVSETHMLLGSHSSRRHVKIVFTSAPTLYKWSRISFNNNNEITRRHDENMLNKRICVALYFC